MISISASSQVALPAKALPTPQGSGCSRSTTHRHSRTPLAYQGEFKSLPVSQRAGQRGLVTCPKMLRKVAAAGSACLSSPLCFLVTSGQEHRECGQTRVHRNLAGLLPGDPPPTRNSSCLQQGGGWCHEALCGSAVSPRALGQASDASSCCPVAHSCCEYMFPSACCKGTGLGRGSGQSGRQG